MEVSFAERCTATWRYCSKTEVLSKKESLATPKLKNQLSTPTKKKVYGLFRLNFA